MSVDVPGVVHHRPHLGQRLAGCCRGARQNVLQFEAMQQARCSAKAVGRVPAVKNRRLQLLSRVQDVAEVEGIEAAGDAHRVQLILLDCDAPRPAPSQRAKPNLAVVFVGGACLNRKPGIGLVAR